ncbi:MULTISPECIES: diacylglycerol/lipid kinase family protein [Sphingomonas]|uniref:diacylglycerol/lipid kinase family protein n=1 Tax=Sphingomonas TaxID=13687 RepID=UPI000DEF68A4|nr:MULTISPECIES: diacylglycerol kinase family protein [Sphingomonas]
MQGLIILNKGGGSAGDDVEERVRAAVADAGLDAEICAVEGAECARRATAARDDGRPFVAAGGGDGTISSVAGILAGSEVPLAVLPLGTLNHFARDLGIPTELEEAVAVLKTGHHRPVDVAEVNGRVFINNSAVGLYPLMVLDREAQQKRLGRSKKLAMLVAGARTLVRFRHHRLRLTINDAEQASVNTPLLFVGNNDYALVLPEAGKRQTLDDGRLCVMVLRSQSRAGMVAAILRALVGRTRDDDLIRLDDVTRLRVASSRSHLAVATDGETEHLESPLDYRIWPKALQVIVPQ